MVSQMEVLKLFWWFKCGREGLPTTEIARSSGYKSCDSVYVRAVLEEMRIDCLVELTPTKELHSVIKFARVTPAGLRAYAAHIEEQGGKAIQDGVYTISSPSGEERVVRVETFTGGHPDGRRAITVPDEELSWRPVAHLVLINQRPYVSIHEPEGPDPKRIDGFELSKLWSKDTQLLACFIDLVHRQTRSWFYGQGMRVKREGVCWRCRKGLAAVSESVRLGVHLECREKAEGNS